MLLGNACYSAMPGGNVVEIKNSAQLQGQASKLPETKSSRMPKFAQQYWF